ncbi:MAG: EAL domain-containing protein [Marinobacter sp.]|uniref:EAL domain-containing protein n=1 Tax=Marinobacter sp. TaxID=50741 RepID=UPI0034A02FD1
MGVVAGVLVTLLWLSEALERSEYMARDGLVALMIQPADSILVIVEIDSASVDAVGQWPWPRELYAQALSRLQQADVASLMIDIDLSAQSTEQQDQLLAEAMQNFSATAPLHLPAFVQPDSHQGLELMFQQPLERFRQFSDLVAVNMQPTDDGLIRFLDAQIRWGEQTYPAAWNAMAGVYGRSTWVDYSIDPRSFEYVSFIDLINGGIDPARLRGQDILIGATAIELGDILATPIHRALPGVVIQALGIQTLKQGGLARLSQAGEAVLLLVFGFAAVKLFLRLPWRQGILSGIVISVAWPMLVGLAYYQVGLMMFLVAPLLLWWLVFLGMSIARLDVEIFERLLAQVRLRDEQALLDRIVSTANDCILCIDDDGQIVRLNPAAHKLTGFSEADLMGKPIAERLPELNQKLDEVSRAPFDTVLKDAAGQAIPVEVTISEVVMSDYHLYTIVVRDLSERVQRERELRYLATHDTLTGLINRNEFFRRVNREIPEHVCVSLLVLNLDYFKEVNDTYGHAVGDRVLREVGARLRSTLANGQIVARAGGDTFAVWLPGVAFEQGGRACGVRLLAALKAPVVITHDDDTVSIQISATVGICELDQSRVKPHFQTGVESTLVGLNEAEGLLRTATNAMMAAKKAEEAIGYFTEEDSREAVRRLELVPAIRTGIRRNEFRLAYQPKLALSDGTVIGAEVLLRWPQAQRSGVPVGTFIEVAENSRQIAPLTIWVMEKILEREDYWASCGLPPHLAVNLSARLVQDAGFIQRLCALLRSSSGYCQFEFEVTETAFMSNPQRALELVDQLADAGAGISIDDYGTGYSSLAYLRDLKAGVLKIDQSFVTNISQFPENQVIVKSTIRMAHDLGMKVVAEGIETEADQRFLCQVHCDFGQGYYFARPMPAEAFHEWVRDHQLWIPNR